MGLKLGRLSVTETLLVGRAALGSRSSSLAAAMPDGLLQAGDLLGQRYQVEEHLSHGGMGVVFRGRDLVTGDSVAIKVLRADRQHESLLTRFRHEYYLMATLSHPRFVEVRDLVVTKNGLPCLVMEYVPGDDLDRLLPLSPEEGIEVIDQLCDALAFLHARRYVHHDLKSNNVRISRDESGRISARLIDFGIMEPVGSVRRELAGTPAYLPPEVLYGAPTDPRLDLYSLGVLAFEVFSGYVPFDIRDAESFVQAKQVSPPDVRKLLGDAPPQVADLIADLMSPEPTARPQDASVVRRRLRAFAPQLGAAPQLTAPTYLKPSRLLGRDRELKQLMDLWETSATYPVLGCVRGQAGLGKSALLRELALRMRLRGGSAELVTVDPSGGAFGVLRPLLRFLWRTTEFGDRPELIELAPQLIRILPEVSSWVPGVRAASPHPDPAEDRRQLYQALCDWIEVVKGPRGVALLVDNAHRADGASLEALRAIHAARALGGLCIVLTIRPDATTRDVALTRLLSAAELDIAIGRLDQASVSELLGSLFGSVEPYPKLSAEITAAGQGNPALILELVRELVQKQVIQYSDERWQLPRALGNFPVPKSLAEALAYRLGGVSEDARAVIEVMVVGRRSLSLELLAAASGLSGPRLFAALSSLRDADLVVESGDGYDLVAGLARESQLPQVPLARQRDLHAVFGRLLERKYGEQSASHAAELADHFLHGNAWFKARHYLALAGRELYEAQALTDARPLLEQLERLLVQEGAEREPYGSDLHTQLLETRQRLARLGVAADSDLGDTMFELERQMYLPKVRSLESGAPLYKRVAELTRVIGSGLLSRRVSPSTLPSRLVLYFTATSYQSVLLAMKGEFGKSERVSHTLLPFILGQRSNARGAYASCRCIVLTHQGLVLRAERFGHMALELFADPELAAQVSQADHETGLGGLHTLMTLLYAERGTHEATEWLQRFEQFVSSREQERAWLLPNFLLARLQYHLYRGEVLRTREVEAEYKAAHARTGGFNTQIELKILVGLARAAVAARDLVSAEALCGELSAYPKDEWVAHGWGGVVLADVWRQQRLFARAQSTLDEASKYAVRPGSRCFKLEMRALNTQAALAIDMGRAGVARQHAEAALAIACDEQTRSEYEELWARRVLVFICHEAGDTPGAQAHLSALARLMKSTENPLFEAVYEKLVSEGIGVPADVLLAEHRAAAERLFERLGYAPETLGGTRRGLTGNGNESGSWWNQTTAPGAVTRDQETIVATPESVLTLDRLGKRTDG